VDLSYRILKAGFENIYFPEVNLIHYKGESTRKMTLSYVRIFNEALVTFVKKHYSRQDARLFVLFIKLGIILRAVMGAAKTALKVLRMPLFDALILLGTLYGIKEFWVNEVKNIFPIPASSVYATFPVYALLWLVSLYFNGAYDSPYRPLKVIRGMLMGTIVILAYFGLLPAELRYSRAIIVFSGIVGTVGLLALHEVLYRLGILKYIPYDKLPKRAVIVANEQEYKHTADILQKVHYAPELSGRVSPTKDSNNALAALPEMKQLLYTTGVNEVIFCVEGLSYLDVLKQMQTCGNTYEYKIHLTGSQSFVGSNSSNTSGDLYTVDRSFNLSAFAMQRNKRMLDIAISLILLVLFPFTFFLAKKPGSLLANIFNVLTGGKTWIGYAPGAATSRLPTLRPGALPPYNILPGYEPTEHVKLQINLAYAQHYTPATDIGLVMKNWKTM
jgi:hypothetical protein